MGSVRRLGKLKLARWIEDISCRETVVQFIAVSIVDRIGALLKIAS